MILNTHARNWSEHDFERSFHILLCSVAFFKPCMDHLVLGDLNMTCWTSTDMNVLGKTLNYHHIFRPYLTSKWTQTTPQCTCQGGKDSFGFVFFCKKWLFNTCMSQCVGGPCFIPSSRFTFLYKVFICILWILLSFPSHLRSCYTQLVKYEAMAYSNVLQQLNASRLNRKKKQHINH